MPGADVSYDLVKEAIGVDGGKAGIKDFVDIVCRESCGNHSGKKLGRLCGQAIDANVGVMKGDLGGGLRHCRGEKCEGLTDELA